MSDIEQFVWKSGDNMTINRISEKNGVSTKDVRAAYDNALREMQRKWEAQG